MALNLMHTFQAGRSQQVYSTQLKARDRSHSTFKLFLVMDLFLFTLNGNFFYLNHDVAAQIKCSADEERMQFITKAEEKQWTDLDGSGDKISFCPSEHLQVKTGQGRRVNSLS